MRVKIVRIGNSKGIRIPKALLEHYHLKNNVELRVEGNDQIVLSSFSEPPAVWPGVNERGPKKASASGGGKKKSTWKLDYGVSEAPNASVRRIFSEEKYAKYRDRLENPRAGWVEILDRAAVGDDELLEGSHLETEWERKHWKW